MLCPQVNPLASISRAFERAEKQGGAFEYVSSPHFLGEIVIYCGISLVGHGHPLLLLIDVWVVRRV